MKRHKRNCLVLFGAARSGTTLYYRIIGQYLARKRGITLLGEYFNPYMGQQERNLSRVQLAKLLDQRLAVLKRFDRPYFLKVLARQAGDSHFDWLSERHDWIFVERRDVKEQALSFLLASASGTWASWTPQKLRARQLEADPRLLLQFERAYFHYLEMKERLRPTRVLVYEDFLEKPDPIAVLRKLGYRGTLDYSKIPLPVKLNQGDKLRFFKNAGEIRKTWEKTSLGASCSLC